MTAANPRATSRRLTIDGIRSMKGSAGPIVMVTAYDFATAQVVERAGVDLVLVGDSAAMGVLGYATTRLVSVDEMLMLTRAARRGAPASLVVGDLPFGSYESGNELAVATARRFVDAGCDAVKMEGGGATVERVNLLQSGCACANAAEKLSHAVGAIAARCPACRGSRSIRVRC